MRGNVRTKIARGSYSTCDGEAFLVLHGLNTVSCKSFFDCAVVSQVAFQG